MYSYFLAIPLPASVRSHLASFCYGLPQVRWIEEENFYLILRHFGSLSDLTVANIHDCLQNLFFQPFSFLLEGVGHFHSKGNHGTIWIGVSLNPSLISLKKEIDRQLRKLNLPIKQNFYHSHILLGYYDRLSPHKLEDYLITHAGYQSHPIEATQCLLIRSFQTPKHIIYEIIERYSASQIKPWED